MPLDFKMHKDTFTILIGSFARGDGGADSDLDIIRIGHTNPVTRPSHISETIPISYIDYDYPLFSELYQQGSLFIYHALKEGILLDGNQEKWELYKKRFSVIEDHSESINEYISVLEFIDNYPDYEHSYVPFLSNIFKSIKNIGIFKLANDKKYLFDKKSALIKGCNITDYQASLFITANNAFERSLILDNESKTTLRSFALEWKNNQKYFIKRLIHDF